MIAPEDLPVVPVLASVAAEELARLAQTAGDVRLGAGDYAVHEGDERSLFVVLAGRIEVTKVIDGIERVIGQRAPGQIFGEVPIIFGTPYQGSYRATEPTRLMHLSARQSCPTCGRSTAPRGYPRARAGAPPGRRWAARCDRG